MTYHPADGPRLNTLYVPQSTRARRRRTKSRRRRQAAVLALVTVFGAVVFGLAFRNQLAQRAGRFFFRGRAPSLVRDVTTPSGKATAQQNAATPAAPGATAQQNATAPVIPDTAAPKQTAH